MIEGKDFNWVVIGDKKFCVFTKEFLLNRGYCCNNKCKNCPYKKKR